LQPPSADGSAVLLGAVELEGDAVAEKKPAGGGVAAGLFQRTLAHVGREFGNGHRRMPVEPVPGQAGSLRQNGAIGSAFTRPCSSLQR
jgi:hypothetical protein